VTDALPSVAAQRDERMPPAGPATGMARSAIAVVVWTVLVTGLLSTCLGTALGLVQFRDVGYPDSAALLRIADAAHGHALYPPLGQPPYLATLYGPLFYFLLAIPFRLAEAVGANPAVAVRAVIAGAFCGCLGLISLLSWRLSGSRRVALVSALVAGAIVPIGGWTTQIRADFPALLPALAAICLWLPGSGGAPRRGAAALAVGLALLIKQTFVAAPIAIVCWLLYRRRYLEAGRWAASVMAIVGVGYGITWWREPLMLSHVRAVGQPLLDYRGALRITIIAVSQFAVPFAIVRLLAMRSAPDRRVALPLAYCAVAWLIALCTIPQVGGNVNYFWEPLFASAVLAGPAIVATARLDARTPSTVAATLCVLLLWAFLPVIRDNGASIHGTIARAREYPARRSRWLAFVAIIARHHVLSTRSDVTVSGIDPEVPDPFESTVLDRRGAWSFGPVIAELASGRIDAVVIGAGESDAGTGVYRGIRSWSAGMWTALAGHYMPICTLDGDEVWVPRDRPSPLGGELISIGCVPIGVDLL